MCKAGGIYTAFATARAEDAATEYISLIKPDIVISNGGARVTIGGECIYKKMMSADTVMYFTEVLCYTVYNKIRRIDTHVRDQSRNKAETAMKLEMQAMITPRPEDPSYLCLSCSLQ